MATSVPRAQRIDAKLTKQTVGGVFNGLSPRDHIIAAIAKTPNMTRSAMWEQLKDYSGFPSKAQMKLDLAKLQKEKVILTRPIPEGHMKSRKYPFNFYVNPKFTEIPTLPNKMEKLQLSPLKSGTWSVKELLEEKIAKDKAQQEVDEQLKQDFKTKYASQ